jgi:hypothetical protein
MTERASLGRGRFVDVTLLTLSLPRERLQDAPSLREVYSPLPVRPAGPAERFTVRGKELRRLGR